MKRLKPSGATGVVFAEEFIFSAPIISNAHLALSIDKGHVF
jgi:hypothetical protein